MADESAAPAGPICPSKRRVEKLVPIFVRPTVIVLGEDEYRALETAADVELLAPHRDRLDSALRTYAAVRSLWRQGERPSAIAKRLMAVSTQVSDLTSLLSSAQLGVSSASNDHLLHQRIADCCEREQIDLAHIVCELERLSSGLKRALSELPPSVKGGRDGNPAFRDLINSCHDIYRMAGGTANSITRNPIDDTYGGPFFQFIAKLALIVGYGSQRERALGKLIERALREKRRNRTE